MYVGVHVAYAPSSSGFPDVSAWVTFTLWQEVVNVRRQAAKELPLQLTAQFLQAFRNNHLLPQQWDDRQTSIDPNPMLGAISLIKLGGIHRELARTQVSLPSSLLALDADTPCPLPAACLPVGSCLLQVQDHWTSLLLQNIWMILVISE